MSEEQQPSGPPTLGVMGQTMSATDRQDMEMLMSLNPLGESQAQQFARYLQAVAVILGSFASISLEVFSRHTFGERYLTPLRVIIGTVLLALFTVSSSALGSLASFGQEVEPLPFTTPGWQFLVMFLFGLAYVLMGMWHLFNNFYRLTYTGEAWYSRSFGISRFEGLLGRRFLALPPVSDWHLFLYIEPFAWYLLGNVLTILGHFLPTGTLGLWIQICGAFLLIKNQIVYYMQREQDLDMIDARLSVSNRSQSAQGASKRDTAGYSAVPLPLAFDRNRDGKIDAPAITPGMFATPKVLPNGKSEGEDKA